MNTLRIVVANKIATYTQRDGAIVCGNSDYVINFTFDSEWDAYPTKTARFVWNGEFFDQEFTGTDCPAPIIRNATKVSIGVYAGELSTTTSATIECVKSILCESTVPQPEMEKIYSSETQEAARLAKVSASEAETASRSASTSAQEAKTSAESAEVFATDAQTSAVSARTSAEAAKESADALIPRYDAFVLEVRDAMTGMDAALDTILEMQDTLIGESDTETPETPEESETPEEPTAPAEYAVEITYAPTNHNSSTTMYVYDSSDESNLLYSSETIDKYTSPTTVTVRTSTGKLFIYGGVQLDVESVSGGVTELEYVGSSYALFDVNGDGAISVTLWID